MLTVWSGASEAADFRVLSAADVERYGRLFQLEAENRWEESDALALSLENRLLMGHVLYRRYVVSHDYVTPYEELRAWLEAYSDHPGGPPCIASGAQAPPARNAAAAPGETSAGAQADAVVHRRTPGEAANGGRHHLRPGHRTASEGRTARPGGQPVPRRCRPPGARPGLCRQAARRHRLFLLPARQGCRSLQPRLAAGGTGAEPRVAAPLGLRPGGAPAWLACRRGAAFRGSRQVSRRLAVERVGRGVLGGKDVSATQPPGGGRKVVAGGGAPQADLLRHARPRNAGLAARAEFRAAAARRCGQAANSCRAGGHSRPGAGAGRADRGGRGGNAPGACRRRCGHDARAARRGHIGPPAARGAACRTAAARPRRHAARSRALSAGALGAGRRLRAGQGAAARLHAPRKRVSTPARRAMPERRG